VSNVLNEEKQQQVIALGRLGWPLRRIEKETCIRRETAGGYLKAAGVPIRPAGAWGRRPPAKPANEVSPDSGEPAKPANGVSPDSVDPAKPANEVSPDPAPPPATERRSSASRCAPFLDFIELSLSKGRNAKAIWQDLVDDHGFTGRYASVKRFVRNLRGNATVEPRAVIVTPPGEEAQVDYGAGPMVRDQSTGRYRRTRMFVLTLGYSRKAVRILLWKSSTRAWAELHERAFRRLGGSPRLLVLDNLREGVLKPDIYDPITNPLYADLLAHYGATAMPCRVADPDRKGKVERSVGHAKQTPLKGQRFESLEEAQAYLDRWEEHWADTRIHGTTKRQVAAMFAEEKPVLLPLPLEPFRFYQFGERGVNLDGCVEVDAAYYSAPPGWIGRDVNVQWDDRTAFTASATRTSLPTRSPRPHACWPAAKLPARTSERSARICTAATVWWRSVAFRASSRWLKSTAPCWQTTVAPPPWRAGYTPIPTASSGAGWSAARNSRFARSIP
jgi:transposase